MAEFIYYDNSNELYEAGRAQWSQGNKLEALELLQRSVEVLPHFKALEKLGELLIELGRPQEAIVPLAAATTLNRQCRAPAFLAQALLQCGDKDEAKEAAELALSRGPGNRLAKKVLAELDDAPSRYDLWKLKQREHER